MIIAEIIGGLGNQFFEYAHARALSLLTNRKLKLDLSFFDQYKIKGLYRLGHYKCNVDIASEKEIFEYKRKNRNSLIYRSIRKITGYNFYSYPVPSINENFENTSLRALNGSVIYLYGYYTDPRYFAPYNEVITKELELKSSLDKKNSLLLNKIKNTNSVSVHFRRCDYLNNKVLVNLPLDYYQKSIELIIGKVNNPVFYIFSDDINWVKQNFQMPYSVNYIDFNNANTDYMELELMSSCKHNIIANSTFSWWGAFLNKNKEKIIISPKSWYVGKKRQDLYQNGYLVPSDWIKI